MAAFSPFVPSRRTAPLAARALALAGALGLAACAGHVDTVVDTSGARASAPRDWRQVATPADRERLRGWRSDFVAALAEARRDGHGPALDAEGALVVPDAALPGAPLANGRYRCRVLKLGARSAGMPTFLAYDRFACRVRQEQGLQGFAKLDGSQRPIGLLFPDGPLRQLFLGTLVLGDEKAARRYGTDPDRDLVGIVERVGDRRWRMLLPGPRHESRLDLIELVPAEE